MAFRVVDNIMIIGAVAGIGVLPLDRTGFEAVIADTLSADNLEVNLKAYDMGAQMVAGGNG
jgi:Pyruvate/2-oxoacid:ferredoxin oxidoreductase gamma subunit